MSCMTYRRTRRIITTCIPYHVRVYGSIVGRISSAMPIQTSRRRSCVESTINLALRHLLHLVNTNPNGPGGRNHLFHPEELFLFMMMTCHTGMTRKALCAYVFGGNASRWSFGYPWILRYVDTRYARTLSHEKLREWQHDTTIMVRQSSGQGWTFVLGVYSDLLTAPLTRSAVQCLVLLEIILVHLLGLGNTISNALFTLDTRSSTASRWKVETVLLPNGIITL
jgi:hypothetical protein